MRAAKDYLKYQIDLVKEQVYGFLGFGVVFGIKLAAQYYARYVDMRERRDRELAEKRIL